MKYRLPKNKKEKILKKRTDIQFWKGFFVEGALFLIVSVLAITTAFELNKIATTRKIYLPKTSLQDVFFSLLFVAFFILLFIVYRKTKKFKKIIYKGFFILFVFWGGVVVLNLFLPVFGSVFIMGVLITLWLEFSTVLVHNILVILGLAGTAGFFGLSFTSPTVVALLLAFSIYDFIATYRTKYIVAMLKDMIDKGVVLGFIIPKKINNFKDRISQLKPERDTIILGGGYVVFPTLLAASVVPSGFLRALIVITFSLAGMLFNYFIFSWHRGVDGSVEPIPALPPIALFATAGYLIALVF